MNVRHDLYPSASVAEKRGVYAWARNVNPVVGMDQGVRLGSRRHGVWFDEGQTFSLGLRWDRTSGRQRCGTGKRATWWDVNLGGRTDYNWWTSNDLGVCGSDDAQRPGSIRRPVCFPAPPCLSDLRSSISPTSCLSRYFLRWISCNWFVLNWYVIFATRQRYDPDSDIYTRCANASTMQLDQPENCSISLNWVLGV